MATGTWQTISSPASTNLASEGLLLSLGELSDRKRMLDFSRRKDVGEAATSAGQASAGGSSPPASPGSSSSSSSSSWFSSSSSSSGDGMSGHYSSGDDGSGSHVERGKRESHEEEEEEDDGSVASRLLCALGKSASSPSLSFSCKEVARETPFQKALRLKNLKLQHCTEELGSESCGDYSSELTAAPAGYMGNTFSAAYGCQMRECRENPAPASEDVGPCSARRHGCVAARSTVRLPQRSRSMSDFPPPLMSSAGCGSSATLLQPVRQDGRLLLKEVKALRCTTPLHAARAAGRLTLYLPHQHSEQLNAHERSHLRIISTAAPRHDSDQYSSTHPHHEILDVNEAATSPVSSSCSNTPSPHVQDSADQYSADILLADDDIEDDVSAAAGGESTEEPPEEEIEQALPRAAFQRCPATYPWRSSAQKNPLETPPLCYDCSSGPAAPRAAPTSGSPSTSAANAGPSDPVLEYSLGFEALPAAAIGADNDCSTGLSARGEGDDGILTEYVFQGASSLPLPTSLSTIQQQRNIAAHCPSSHHLRPPHLLLTSNHEWLHRLHCKELEYRNELGKHKVHCVATRS